MASEKFLLDTATELPEYMFRLAATINFERTRQEFAKQKTIRKLPSKQASTKVPYLKVISRGKSSFFRKTDRIIIEVRTNKKNLPGTEQTALDVIAWVRSQVYRHSPLACTDFYLRRLLIKT